MLKLSLKNLAARKFRLLTTGVAILLGVAFMTGTLVLGDTITNTFDDLFSNVFKGTDAQVRGVEAFKAPDEAGSDATRPLVDESVLAAVRTVPSVADAEGTVEGYAQVVGKDGKVVGKPGHGAPTFGTNWKNNLALNAYQVVTGRPPAGDDEITLDARSAKEGKYVVGETVRLLTKSGPVQARLVGVAKFGKLDSAGGSTQVMMTLSAAQRLLGQPGKFSGIDIVADKGVSQAAVREAVAKVIPQGTEVITGATLTKENQDNVAKFVGIFKNVLLSFALIALFVGSFIIYNTFSILVTQRVREMALLRAIGATRRQVMRSLVLEALAIGLLASVLGAVAGVAVASGLKALLAAFGLDVPATGLTVTPRAITAAVVTGTLVATVAAWFPSRRGAKVPPIAAMRDVALERAGRPTVRIAIGLVLVAVGMLSLFSGLSGGDGALQKVGLGAVLILCGVTAVGPIAARPVTRVLGAPLATWRGVSGTLARENAMRNPRRTATTASALLIGVSLVSFITIFASSAKASISNTFNKQFTGDIVLNSDSFARAGVSTKLERDLRELPELSAVSPVRQAVASFAGNRVFLTGLDARQIGKIADLGIEQGSLADLDGRSVAISDAKAKDERWSIGTVVPVVFPDTGPQQLTVRMIYKNTDLASRYWVDTSVLDANVRDQFDTVIVAKIASGVSVKQAFTAVSAVAKAYPNLSVQDRKTFIADQSGRINQMVALIYVLLFLALIIALFGIANTLALSIVERTREVGLLRAVGMTRPQLRSTVRWEAVLIALFGAVGGLGVGFFFGWSFIRALADDGFNTFNVPIVQLAVIALAACVFGVIAAVVPARRAGKLDVLRAIATV